MANQHKRGAEPLCPVCGVTPLRATTSRLCHRCWHRCLKEHLPTDDAGLLALRDARLAAEAAAHPAPPAPPPPTPDVGIAASPREPLTSYDEARALWERSIGMSRDRDVNSTDYDVIADELLAEARRIEIAKRPGYTIGSTDVLANFVRVADRTGASVGQVWAVYFLKHVDAITTVMTQPDQPCAEAPLGRFADAINYLRLGYALYVERMEAGRRSDPLDV